MEKMGVEVGVISVIADEEKKFYQPPNHGILPEMADGVRRPISIWEIPVKQPVIACDSRF